ncbi:MAG: SEC-C metal-binding domain-containing protein [Gammaproteobacteria bacterium]
MHRDKELLERLGRNDPCPCGSGRRFQEMLHEIGPHGRRRQRALLLETEYHQPRPPEGTGS